MAFRPLIRRVQNPTRVVDVKPWHALDAKETQKQIHNLLAHKPHGVESALRDGYNHVKGEREEVQARQEGCFQALLKLNTRRAKQELAKIAGKSTEPYRTQLFDRFVTERHEDVLLHALTHVNDQTAFAAFNYLNERPILVQAKDLVKRAGEHVRAEANESRNDEDLSLARQIIIDHAQPRDAKTIVALYRSANASNQEDAENWLRSKPFEATFANAHEDPAIPNEWRIARRAADFVESRLPANLHDPGINNPRRKLHSRLLAALLNPAQARTLRTAKALDLFARQIQIDSPQTK